MNDFTATNIEPKMKARDTRSHFNAFTITLLVFLILYTISLFTPLIWGASALVPETIGIPS